MTCIDTSATVMNGASVNWIIYVYVSNFGAPLELTYASITMLEIGFQGTHSELGEM